MALKAQDLNELLYCESGYLCKGLSEVEVGFIFPISRGGGRGW